MTKDTEFGLGRRAFMATSALGAGASSLLAGRPLFAQADTGDADGGGGVAAGGGATPPPASAATAARAVEASRDAILRISREVWAEAELSLAEDRSSKIHLRELEAAGFRIVSTGTSGTPTAFVAEWTQGSGGPVIGFLPEYDALPGLGNAAEPRQAPGPTGLERGHGCGHNLIGAGCTGAAIALKAMMEAEGTSGTIRVYGCAAEETQGVKVYMARDGLFDDCDACLAWHPAPIAATGLVRTTATNMMRIGFRGRTAHAGNSPWEGRSALKAAELCATGIQFMREHILPSARLHYVYTSAGTAPNVVPAEAEIWLTIRGADRDRVAEMTEWVQQIAHGAAMMTQTEAQPDVFFGLWDILPNAPLVALMQRHMEAVGLAWTEEEQAFARACQREMGAPEAGLATEVLAPFGDLQAGGSSDVGDVSWNTPTALFAWPTLPLGIGLHTWPVTACGGMSIGDRASLDTARIMAGAGYDLMTDAHLRAGVRADFEARTSGTAFVSPLAPDRLRPDGIPEFLLIRQGEDELVAPLVEEG
jgi:aminobenzoyl-glutamate utilization protein B